MFLGKATQENNANKKTKDVTCKQYTSIIILVIELDRVTVFTPNPQALTP